MVLKQVGKYCCCCCCCSCGCTLECWLILMLVLVAFRPRLPAMQQGSVSMRCGERFAQRRFLCWSLLVGYCKPDQGQCSNGISLNRMCLQLQCRAASEMKGCYSMERQCVCCPPHVLLLKLQWLYTREFGGCFFSASYKCKVPVSAGRLLAHGDSVAKQGLKADFAVRLMGCQTWLLLLRDQPH